MITSWKNAFSLAGFLLYAIPALSQEPTVFKTYPLSNPETNAIIEVVKALVGDKVQIFYYKPNNELIISATSNQHIQITKLLKEINIPPPNIRIEVIFNQPGRETDFGAGLNENGPPKVVRKGSSYQVEINPYVRNQTTSTIDNSSQSLLVKSGKEARIFMGHEVPFYTWLIDFGLQWNYINLIEQKFEMKQVGSALIVQPQVIGRGPMISLTLVPELSGLVDGKPHKIQYTRVATELTVRDGEQVTIGSFGKNTDFYNKFLVGVDKRGSHRSVQIRLTAHILKPESTM
jgi:hypothetical protein